jgi:hypothetical protein
MLSGDGRPLAIRVRNEKWLCCISVTTGLLIALQEKMHSLERRCRPLLDGKNTTARRFSRRRLLREAS